MQEYLQITGGNSISGEVQVSGAKNAALPLLIATILSAEKSTLRNIPALEDIDVLLELLKSLGADIEREDQTNTVSVRVKEITSTVAPYSLVKLLRASFWLLGPLLARAGHAEVALPGGDAIGVRPVDIHLDGLRQMGAEIILEHGLLKATAKSGLKPANIKLKFPSVGATHHLMMTAALVPGETILSGVAREPEVVELANLLKQMGAEIKGEGSEEISIIGLSSLSGAKQDVLGDRVEAATFLVAAATTGGQVEIRGIDQEAIGSTLEVLEEAGCEIKLLKNGVKLSAPSKLQNFKVKTAPFPGLATDMQPLIMALATKAEGRSEIVETIFESRFGHIAEYRRFGANISVEGSLAVIEGVSNLQGASVHAGDIRAAAGLVLMGLMSEGLTSVFDIHHLDRGYDKIQAKLNTLGASISRVPVYERKELVIGC